MTELLTAAQMRAIEMAAIEAGEVTGLELMERAGRGVVEAVFEEWPELAATSHRAVVLCGPGNNGGDGFVVARLLKEWGWEVEVFLYGDPEKLPPDAQVNHERWGELGEVKPLDTETYDGKLRELMHCCDLVVDAFFGTGLRRPISGLHHLQSDLAWGVRDRESGHAPDFPRVVSVDFPSGLCSDSGKYLQPETADLEDEILAHLTVTFHAPKLAHFLDRGPELCGKLFLKSIGLESYARHDPVPVGSKTILPGEGVECLAKPHVLALKKSGASQKYENGHVLILSGGAGHTGAARLAARGALRIGAGLVTMGVPGAAQMEVASQVSAIMLKRAGTEEELASVLDDKRINAVCMGPGLGLERARWLVEVVLRGVEPRPAVLDADALTAFEDEPDELFGMLREDCVLTPHGGEFARLFPDIAEKLNATPTKGPAYSKVDATRAAAKRAGCVVLFKGPDTVIAAPDGRCSINSAFYERAAPWLATAGSGDVLAGFITGLLARGFSAMQAAETGAWLHVECARAFGPGLIAEDLPEALPGVFRYLGV